MNYELKPKEYEIMKFIWANAAEGVSFGDIHEHVNSLGKQESRQRVNCFIQSLIAKDMLTASGEDRRKIYTPLMSKIEYDRMVATNILEQLFDGSLKKFITALNGGDHLSEEKAKELRKILKDARNKK